ncbi:DUF1624 domain-containing protein [bacterium]|nr:DUF1624 domain-containing protein [bacterium]
MNTPVPAPARKRLESLDAFRGFTIFGMIFVIAVAAGGYRREGAGLPQVMSWLDSLPVSTWLHASVAYDAWEEEAGSKWKAELAEDATFAPGASAEERAEAISAEVERRIAAAPETNLKGVGVTFTDLIAPFFVFIVGVVIPIGRRRDASEYYLHALYRTAMLILAGIVYISLVIKGVSWWWGVLQAIGIAYLCAAVMARFDRKVQWIAVFAVAGLNLLMTETTSWWTGALNSSQPFGTLTNPGGDWLRTWRIHCLPWLSISYGTMAMIGVLVGNAISTRDDKKIIQQSLLIGGLFTLLGFLIHKLGIMTGNYSLCANKDDVTTSYSFFTAGLGAITFAGFYWVIDVKGWKLWARPFVDFGVNPLVAYFLQIVMRRGFESLGVIDIFNRTTADNKLVNNWAVLLGSEQEPARLVLDFFHKGGYMGIFWGLVWTACLYAILRWFNKKGFFWKF